MSKKCNKIIGMSVALPYGPQCEKQRHDQGYSVTFASLCAARPKIAFVAGWGRPGSMMIDDEELRMVKSFSEVLCFIPDHPAPRILFPAFKCVEVLCRTIIEGSVLRAFFKQLQICPIFGGVSPETFD